MDKAKITITISKKDKTVKSVVACVSGQRCTELTARLDQLGRVVSDEKLPAFFQQEGEVESLREED